MRLSRRFLLIAALSPFRVHADESGDALDAVAPLADALSNSDPESFLRVLPGDLPSIAELRDSVNALMAQAEVSSSVEVITAEKGSAELDWYMEIRSRATRSVIEQRRAVVKIRYKKRRLQSIEPASFFAPPKPDSDRK